MLAIGVMVLCFAVVEGSANDWLSLALIDGYGVPHWVGVSGYALFVSAMTFGRLTGTTVLDRFGRAPVLWSTALAAADSRPISNSLSSEFRHSVTPSE